MKGMLPTNLTQQPNFRAGPKTVSIPISFAAADTDQNHAFRFDLTLEMMSGQLDTPQTMVFDNTAGAVDVQMRFLATNQFIRFPVRSYCILPLLAKDYGGVEVRYQTSDWASYIGFNDNFYKPTLYILNTFHPPMIAQKPAALEGCSGGTYTGVCTGGLASDLVFDAVVNGTTPETRVALYIENPATETEPLYWNIGGSASANRYALYPGEHILLGNGAPMSQGSFQVAAATAGHVYKAKLFTLY